MCYPEEPQNGPGDGYMRQCSCHGPEPMAVGQERVHYGGNKRRGMCHPAFPGHGPNGCHVHRRFCQCHDTQTAEEKIQALEEHKKFLQQKIAMIDTKIAGLKPEKES